MGYCINCGKEKENASHLCDSCAALQNVNAANTENTQQIAQQMDKPPYQQSQPFEQNMTYYVKPPKKSNVAVIIVLSVVGFFIITGIIVAALVVPKVITIMKAMNTSEQIVNGTTAYDDNDLYGITNKSFNMTLEEFKAEFNAASKNAGYYNEGLAIASGSAREYWEEGDYYISFETAEEFSGVIMLGFNADKKINRCFFSRYTAIDADTEIEPYLICTYVLEMKYEKLTNNNAFDELWEDTSALPSWYSASMNTKTMSIDDISFIMKVDVPDDKESEEYIITYGFMFE